MLMITPCLHFNCDPSQQPMLPSMKNREQWGEGAYHMVSKFCKFFFTSFCVSVCVLIKIKYFKTDQNFIEKKKKSPKILKTFFEKTFYNEKK